MKKTFLLCILFALCCGGATRVLAAINPGERFLDAFFLIQDGDAAQAKSDWQTAYDKYAAALTVLQEIKAQAPDWNTRLVDYRTGYCTDHLAEIKPKLPPPAPPVQEAAPAAAVPETAGPAPVAAPAAAVPAPAAPVAEATAPAAPAPAENGQIQQLTDELRQSQEKFHQMEQDRDALKARLDEELNKPAPSDRAEAQKALDQLHALEAVRDALNAKLQDAEAKAVQVETLKAALQKSQEKVRQLEASEAELAAQAAKSQEEIHRLETSQAEQAAKSGEKIRQLEASQADLKAKLKEALSKAPPGQPAAQTGDWQKKNADLAAKLAETERQLRAAKSSNEKNSEIIVALRKENEQLHEALNRAPAANMTEPEETQTSSGLNTELRGWHPRRLSQTTEEASSRPTLATAKQAPASGTSTESGNNKKLVATINAPGSTPPTAAKTNTVQVVPAPVKTNTVHFAAAPVAAAAVNPNPAPAAPAPVAPVPAANAGTAPAEAAPVEVTPVRVTKVNNSYRFVVIDFASHPMPSLGTRLAVYRDGKQVAHVQLTEPVRDRFATADILDGQIQVGDELH